MRHRQYAGNLDKRRHGRMHQESPPIFLFRGVGHFDAVLLSTEPRSKGGGGQKNHQRYDIDLHVTIQRSKAVPSYRTRSPKIASISSGVNTSEVGPWATHPPYEDEDLVGPTFASANWC